LAGKVPDIDLERSRRSIIRLGEAEVHLLGTVKGLLSEGLFVKGEVERTGPDLIGLHIGKEEVSGLRSVIQGKVDEMPLSSYERLYAMRLSRYGEVMVPPPSLVEAMRAARQKGIPVRPLDMEENRYTQVYTDLISGTTMVRQSLRMKGVARVKFSDKDPLTFALHWDRVVNKLKGYRNLERAREDHMAKRIKDLSRSGGVQLHILEIERTSGILGSLSKREIIPDKIK